MDDTANAQTNGKHEMVDSLDREFARLHLRSRTIIEATPVESLYAGSSGAGSGTSGRPVGESILRSAAAIEQTFGGITANLWDDPFEWTLPEYLSTTDRILAHLDDVEALRRRAFSSFADDSCLMRCVATPSKQTELLMDLLKQTLARALSLQDEAGLRLRSLSGISAAGFII